ncbi:MAG: hypothetical protein COA79_14365 [Planctomycetota bacterium]|nr:MAG: hypothetical protein COA79_14365 [Planctomycetota bacterium]
MVTFDYDMAFSRVVGWITLAEQALLRDSCISIAGMGGVGGSYAISLARLGVGKFKIADFDIFETHNVNRQIGAFISTLGKPKAEVIKNMILDINPTAIVEVYEKGIVQDNVDSFLEGSMMYIDGLDLFCIIEREQVFRRAYELGIPATTVAPVGAGSVTVNFMPNKMSFDDFFGTYRESDLQKKMICFAIGMTLNSKHLKYICDSEAINLKDKSLPSLICGIQSATAVMTTEVFKILLNRGQVFPAPYVVNYDPYLNRYKRSYIFLGSKNPWFLIKKYFANKLFFKDNP